MTPANSILLQDPTPDRRGKITQLFRFLELFSEGDPPRHSLFVMGRDQTAAEQLLLVDPPSDVSVRFRLVGQVAAVFTGEPVTADVPVVQTVVGGTAHLRIGEHFVDLYSLALGAIVHLPALGILCSGRFGSDVTVPALSAHGDGSEELAALRVLARLIKERRLQVMIPGTGSLVTETPSAMRRFAEDVSYVHGMQRVIQPLAERGDGLSELMRIADTLLPAERQTQEAWSVHRANLSRMYGHYSSAQDEGD